MVCGSKGKRLYMEEFTQALEKLGAECRLVDEIEFAKPFPSKKIGDWFRKDKKLEKLLEEFKPDAVFLDRQASVCKCIIKPTHISTMFAPRDVHKFSPASITVSKICTRVIHK